MPVVVAAIDIAHRGYHERIDRQIIQAGDRYGNERTRSDGREDNRSLVQIEQLHLAVPAARSMSAS
jgi:hypothetical protein